MQQQSRLCNSRKPKDLSFYFFFPPPARVLSHKKKPPQTRRNFPTSQLRDDTASFVKAAVLCLCTLNSTRIPGFFTRTLFPEPAFPGTQNPRAFARSSAMSDRKKMQDGEATPLEITPESSRAIRESQKSSGHSRGERKKRENKRCHKLEVV